MKFNIELKAPIQAFLDYGFSLDYPNHFIINYDLKDFSVTITEKTLHVNYIELTSEIIKELGKFLTELEDNKRYIKIIE